MSPVISDQAVEDVDHSDYFGPMIDDRLSFWAHADGVC